MVWENAIHTLLLELYKNNGYVGGFVNTYWMFGCIWIFKNRVSGKRQIVYVVFDNDGITRTGYIDTEIFTVQANRISGQPLVNHFKQCFQCNECLYFKTGHDLHTK